MERLESQLPAAEIKLSDDVLDWIDRLITPGTNINPADGGWVNAAVQPAARRRQPRSTAPARWALTRRRAEDRQRARHESERTMPIKLAGNT